MATAVDYRAHLGFKEHFETSESLKTEKEHLKTLIKERVWQVAKCAFAVLGLALSIAVCAAAFLVPHFVMIKDPVLKNWIIPFWLGTATVGSVGFMASYIGLYEAPSQFDKTSKDIDSAKTHIAALKEQSRIIEDRIKTRFDS